MVKFLSPTDIETAAEGFLREHHPNQSLPIPIEEILDLKLGINIVPMPGLFRQHNIDAFFSSDFTELYIDDEHLENRSNRARFSMAHEAGHLVLHKQYISSLKIDSIEKWKEIVLGKGSGHAVMETQANMFASFLLMPTNFIKEEFEKAKMELKAHPLFESKQFPNDKTQIDTDEECVTIDDFFDNGFVGIKWAWVSLQSLKSFLFLGFLRSSE